MHSSSKGGKAKAPQQFPFQTPCTLNLSIGIILRSRRVYIPVAITLLVMAVFGAFFVSSSLLPRPPIFPTLCSSNFQFTNTSANTVTIPTSVTSTSPDGESIGLSEGATIFDLQRPNQQEVQDKLQAAQDWVNNSQDVVPALQNALRTDQTDAEAQIYLENWKVLASKHPRITFVVGVNFAFSPTGASRDVLQGAFTIQKECNNHNNQDNSQTQIILMIANIGGGDDPADALASNAKSVADQIVDQARIDPTIAGIMGWPRSSDSININHQLKIRGSSLPMVSPSASSDELEARANFFRIVPTDKEQAQIAANFMLNMKHTRRIAVVYDQTTAYSNNLKDDFAKDIPPKMVRLTVPFIGGDVKTLQVSLNNVLAQHPDALFFTGYAKDLVEIISDVSSTPYANLLIVGGDALAVTDNYQNPLPDLHNVYFTSFASANQWDQTNPKPPFFQEYKTNFGTLTAPNGLPSIDATVMLGYDALSTLLYGTQQVHSKPNTLTPSNLTQALKQIAGANAIQGLTGRIAFDSYGNQDGNKMIFVEHIEGTNLVIDEKHGCLFGDNCGS